MYLLAYLIAGIILGTLAGKLVFYSEWWIALDDKTQQRIMSAFVFVVISIMAYAVIVNTKWSQ